jgi:regulator of protease activity HflC (stomatin/prohibitin superfamily)
MNLVFAFIGLAVAVVGIIVGLKKSKRIMPACIIIGVAVFVVGCCFTIVPTGYTGVRTTFGQVSKNIVPQGFNLKVPFVQTIELVNNKQQDTKIVAQVWGESSEKIPVYATEITVTFQVESGRSAWIFSNVTDTKDLITQSLVSSAIKSAMVELPASEVTVRSKIEPLVKEELAESIDEKYGSDTISVLKVVIDQMDFEESYNNAISDKSIAMQRQAQQEIENNTAIAKAEADKKVAIANAEAEAEATRIAAEAEAAANKLIAESLTDEILKSKFYEKWDGKLPSVMGDNAVISNIGETK